MYNTDNETAIPACGMGGYFNANALKVLSKKDNNDKLMTSGITAKELTQEDQWDDLMYAETYTDYVEFSKKHTGKHGDKVDQMRITTTWYEDGTVVDELDELHNNGETYTPKEIKVDTWTNRTVKSIQHDRQTEKQQY